MLCFYEGDDDQNGFLPLTGKQKTHCLLRFSMCYKKRGGGKENGEILILLSTGATYEHVYNPIHEFVLKCFFSYFCSFMFIIGSLSISNIGVEK